jgi:ubiquinone/menaquinone biosynthesis C-methylase UbiE
MSAQAREAYDAAADVYDDFTAHHDYDGWTALIERLARAHGLAGDRLLDVGCGTGNSFLPFLERGYRITACDISPRMLARAREKCDGRARLSVADLRSLPRLGSFDLVLAIDDVPTT